MKTKDNTSKRACGSFILTFFFLIPGLKSQNLDVPYVPTPSGVVERMLDITGVGPGDYVIDLGSGDGRIVIAAAERGAVGHGIDLNPVRISEARQNAVDAGVDHKVMFVEGDLFETDISKASVVTMYLLSSVNIKLRPMLLETLKPGTRLVSHSFSMGEWEPDQHSKVDNRSVYLWIIPAKAQGTWAWSSNGEEFTMNVNQEFQKINLEFPENDLVVEDPVLSGDRICFIADDPENGAHYVFNGIINGERISGTTQIRNGDSEDIEEWSASLIKR